VLNEGPGDENRPVCIACNKKNRPCQWEAAHTKFRDYQPGAVSSISPPDAIDGEEETDDDQMEVDGADRADRADGFHGDDGIDGDGDGDMNEDSRDDSPNRKNSRTGQSSEGLPASLSSPSARHSPASPFGLPPTRSYTGAASVADLLSTQAAGSISDGCAPNDVEACIELSHHEALLVHHYTEHLGRWLDCTDATRQFTLGVPQKVKSCPVLCNAVLSFAARHSRDHATAETAYQECIELLIDRLSQDAASHDETLLCAIVILRFYEQLNGMSTCTRAALNS
jgi:hypothetical protein